MHIEHIDDIAILRMVAGKANAIDFAFLENLGALLDQCGDARALVITGHGRFFSAGVALPVLIEHDRAGVTAFIDLFWRTMARVYTLPIPVIAAINGHAIAGGCVLALQADRRILVEDDIRIGINEVQLGIGLPAQVLEPLRAEVPVTSLHTLAHEGRLVMPHEALALSLVHALAPPELLESRALDLARSLARIPRAAYAQVKRGLRDPVMKAVESSRAVTDEEWVDTWFSDEAQTLLRAAVDRLRSK